MKGRAILAVGMVAGLLSGAFLLTRPDERPVPSNSRPTAPRAGGVLREPGRDEGPFLFGREVSFDQAAREAKYHLYRPNHPIANDDNIRKVFIEATSDDSGRPWAHVAIDYESGILILILPAWVDGFETPDKAQKQYEQIVSQYPGSYARIEEVHGVSALVVERNPRANSYVEVVLDGVRVRLTAKYAPLGAATLIEVASSLR